MAPDELKRRTGELRWHHSIDLGHGIITPGQDNSARKLERLQLPPSFAGKSVLDVGAWDGFFSFEAERRGARRVLATDSYSWNGSHDWGDKRGFDLAKAALGSKVEEKEIDVLDLAPEKIGTFDVVLFLGVLYHMRHPLLSLERVASVTGEMLILETVVDMLSCRRPAMAFYPFSELGKDATNWCGPNPAAVIGMLKVVGFKRIEIVSGLRPFYFRLAKAIWLKCKRGHQFWSMLRTDRIVVHAWK
ncbi:MAG: class I SAM-dependent methyltransferase [Verrucomicrobiota bacterium]